MKNKKVADSGLRILQVLKALSKSPVSMDEMMKIVAENDDIEPIYTYETFNKYINTLKLLGFEIHKKNKKYVMKNSLSLINLNNENLRIYKFIRNYAEKIYLNQTNKELMDFFDMVEQMFDEDTEKRFAENKRNIGLKDFCLTTEADKVKKFEKLCNDRQKLKIIVVEKNKQKEYKIDPRKILYEKEYVYLTGYDFVNDETVKIKLNDIVLTTQLPQKSTPDKSSKYITYILLHRLALCYVLKMNEKIVETENNNYLMVSNTNEDLKTFYTRLLRYGENCEILYPKSVRDGFVEHIDKIIGIYEK